MATIAFLVLLSGIAPFAVAWRRLRQTSLAHAIAWAMLAWLAWAVVLALAAMEPSALMTGRYSGLCLIACAGVAVLGARHPRVGAWNFVVAGLLAVLLLPWMEGFLTGGEVELGVLRAAFLASALFLVVVNYLFTSLAPAALLLGVGCSVEIAALLVGAPWKGNGVTALWEVGAGLLLGLVPWAAWAAIQWRSTAASSMDALWRDFRDRYGVVWAQRVREQFNRSAAHAGWQVELGWNGLRSTDEGRQPDLAAQEESRAILEALLKRFGLLGTEAE